MCCKYYPYPFQYCSLLASDWNIKFLVWQKESMGNFSLDFFHGVILKTILSLSYASASKSRLSNFCLYSSLCLENIYLPLPGKHWPALAWLAFIIFSHLNISEWICSPHHPMYKFSALAYLLYTPNFFGIIIWNNEKNCLFLHLHFGMSFWIAY